MPGANSTNEIFLHRLPAKQLETEARAAGFQPYARRRIQSTNDHAGSVIVVLTRP